MKIPPLLTGLAVFANVNLLISSHLAAQVPTPTPPEMVVVVPPTEVAENIISQVPLPETDAVATIVFPNGWFIKARCTSGVSPLMGISASETVNVQVTFPPTAIGQTITVEALDGGSATAAKTDETVAPDRLVPFVFTAGDQPGLYRIVIKVGEIDSTLEFWVANPDDPDVNPPVLSPTPGSPGPV